MKKILAIVISVFMLTTLAACNCGSSAAGAGNSENQTSDGQTASTSAASQAAGEGNSKSVEIVRPDTTGMPELLTYPGAEVLISDVGYIVMTTDDSLADVKAFYLAAAKDLGAVEMDSNEEQGWEYLGEYGEGWDLAIFVIEEAGILTITVNYAS